MKPPISLICSLLMPFCLNACEQQTPSQPPAVSAPIQNTNFQGSPIKPSDNIGGDFTLSNGQGQPFRLSSLKGKAIILAFGFTHCPDVCPTEMLTYKDVMAQLGETAKNVAVVFVSVDPERDTPDLIGRYATQFHPDFIGLTATAGQDLALVKQQYRIISAKTEVKSETVYNIDHTSGAYLLDKQGNVAVFEPFGSDATQIAHDLRLLLQS